MKATQLNLTKHEAKRVGKAAKQSMNRETGQFDEAAYADRLSEILGVDVMADLVRAAKLGPVVCNIPPHAPHIPYAALGVVRIERDLDFVPGFATLLFHAPPEIEEPIDPTKTNLIVCVPAGVAETKEQLEERLEALDFEFAALKKLCIDEWTQPGLPEPGPPLEPGEALVDSDGNTIEPTEPQAV